MIELEFVPILKFIYNETNYTFNCYHFQYHVYIVSSYYLMTNNVETTDCNIGMKCFQTNDSLK